MMMTPARKEPDAKTYQGRCAIHLKKLREQAQLTPEQVAQAVGVSIRTIYHWEAAKRDIPLSMLPILSEIFELESPRLVLAEK
ncbi:MAG: helix-turn-helix domain-containing protein [Planctomycetaceae bacterium]|nr:helix-turn-helix domain-containing protein [Planctomycetaceae bacterium]